MPQRRIADVQLGELLQKVETLVEKMDDQIDRQQRMEDRLKKLEVDYIRYRSFLGGILFFLTAVWAFLSSAWDVLRQTIHRIVE